MPTRSSRRADAGARDMNCSADCRRVSRDDIYFWTFPSTTATGVEGFGIDRQARCSGLMDAPLVMYARGRSDALGVSRPQRGTRSTTV